MSQQALGAASDATRPIIIMDVAVFVTAALLPLLLFGLPLYVSETIPYDRQYGVRDLLDALPLSGSTYLLGKVLAVWVSLLLAISISGVVTGVVSTVVFGALDVGEWANMWLGGFLVMGLLASGISILLAAGQPNRRRALLVGFLSLPIYFIVYALSPLAVRLQDALLRISIFPLGSNALDAAPVNGLSFSWSFVGWSIVGIVAVWMLTWGWMRVRGGRA